MRLRVIRCPEAIAALSAVLAAVSVFRLAPTASLSAGGAVPWALPHTPDGQPDLRGYWTNATFTPLERPAELAGKEFMTEAEAAAYEKKRQLQEESQAKDDIHYDNVIWQKESYDKVVTRRRTSIVVDPPDGKIPPLTPLGQQRAAARAEAARTASVRQRGVAQPRRTLHLVGQRRAADARLDLQRQPADHADEQAFRDSPRDGSRRADDSGRWHAASRFRASPAARRLARPVGRQHAGRGHHELHRRDAVPRTAGHGAPGHQQQPRPARRGTLHAHRRQLDPLSVHRRRSVDVDEAVVGGDA